MPTPSSDPIHRIVLKHGLALEAGAIELAVTLSFRGWQMERRGEGLAFVPGRGFRYVHDEDGKIAGIAKTADRTNEIATLDKIWTNLDKLTSKDRANITKYRVDLLLACDYLSKHKL